MSDNFHLDRNRVAAKCWSAFAVFVVSVVVGTFVTACGLIDTSNQDIKNDVKQNQANPTVSTNVSIFDGDCGVSASAEIGKNIINFPEITITVTNTTDKEIAAIQFYAVPYDVYGDEIKGWSAQNWLYTDTAIPAGDTTVLSFQLIEESVKSVKLYVYSVYFSDGTEWGDKDATSSQILKEAPTIVVEVKS